MEYGDIRNIYDSTRIGPRCNKAESQYNVSSFTFGIKVLMRDPSALAATVERFVDSLAHCRKIGIRVVSARENELVLELPYSEQLVGNPRSGVIHGEPLPP